MKKSLNKILLAIILIICTAAAVYYCYHTGIYRNFTSEGIRDYVKSMGSLGPIVYMIMFSVIPSGSVIAIAGGMAFGMYFGTLYTTLGALLGSTTAFYIAKLLGREAVEKLFKGKIQSFEAGLEKNGFLLILILRLIPVIPFNAISYGAGLTKVRFRDYFMATMIGILPGVVVFTNLGDKAVNIKSTEFIGAIALFLGLILASLILKKRVSFNKLQSRFNRDK